MNKFTCTAIGLFILFNINTISGQESFPYGSPIGLIYADYKYQLNGVDGFNGFSVSRAFMGYNYYLNDNFSARIVMDLGDPLRTDNVSSRRYTYLRNAYMAYNNGDLTLTFGVTDCRGHKVPNSFWGKRFVAKPFLPNYGFVDVADLGVIADYEISPAISVDFSILNGEGYNDIQLDNCLMYAGGITLTPIKDLTFRLYTDIHNLESATTRTISTFAGYKNSMFTIGAGYNYKTNYNFTEGQNIYGVTTMALANLSPRLELFARYDILKSVIAEGETISWNSENDGSLIICGLLFKINPHIKFALNYQGWSPASAQGARTDFLQVNSEFRF